MRRLARRPRRRALVLTSVGSARRSEPVASAACPGRRAVSRARTAAVRRPAPSAEPDPGPGRGARLVGDARRRRLDRADRPSAGSTPRRGTRRRPSRAPRQTPTRRTAGSSSSSPAPTRPPPRTVRASGSASRPTGPSVTRSAATPPRSTAPRSTALSHDPSVAMIVADEEIEAEAQIIPTGISRIDAHALDGRRRSTASTSASTPTSRSSTRASPASPT